MRNNNLVLLVDDDEVIRKGLKELIEPVVSAALEK